MNLAPPETLAWLEQFGFKLDLNGRKKHSFDSSNSSFDTYSFDDADKTIQPLGIGLRSTLGKRSAVINFVFKILLKTGNNREDLNIANNYTETIGTRFAF